MGPKYEFTGETMRYDGSLLHRIRRIEDGKLGGWIEKEENLSQEGNCWVDGVAKVFDDARVCDDAQIYDGAEVYNDAEVSGKAKVNYYAQVRDNARVSGNAKVYIEAVVEGNAVVYGNAIVYGYVGSNAKVYGNAKVQDEAIVNGNAVVCGDAEVWGGKITDNAIVKGNALVGSGDVVCGNAVVWGKIIDGDISNSEQLTKVVQDFIYKVDDSNKLNVKTEYNSIDEYFSSSYQNDSKLDTLVISAVDTKISLIKIEKVDVESKTEFKFIVDITNEKGSNFNFKSVIKDAEQLNSLITQTIDALNSYPEFAKYTNDLADCL